MKEAIADAAQEDEFLRNSGKWSIPIKCGESSSASLNQQTSVPATPPQLTAQRKRCVLPVMASVLS